ncbi:GntR family transcriptional regulator [Alphaproteobacteria bacterium KMM 3653]|uniref:GntR family transcriptional regulator n=2 Tax=Harenicola maris TaxID=2841044 RepID=A0AAP2CS51_9RHOB|nr:GntR family transcriptional regulator [Harenicola maris]
MPSLPTLRPPAQPSVADQVFDALQNSILTLHLPPHSKISETEVAGQMGVSRQPVREAFKRLAKLGYLTIRPQSGTTVSPISEEAVERARFIRTALEVQTLRAACGKLGAEALKGLSDLLEAQKRAVTAGDREGFHNLDDAFHRMICEETGVGFVWDMVLESKAHMDRIRLLSLNASSRETALREHIDIYEAIAANDPDRAADVITSHLARITLHIEAVKAQDHRYFSRNRD